MNKKPYRELEDVGSGDEKHPLNNGRTCSYFRATTLERWLAVLLTLAVLSILGLAIYIGIDRATKHDKVSGAGKSCHTQDCVAYAGEVAASLNTTANPCDDFYEYACGGYVASHIRPDDMGRLGSFTALKEKNFQRLRQILSSTPPSNDSAVGKASQVYATCLDQTTLNALGTQPVLDYIKSLGGMPVVPNTWSESSWDINTAFANVQVYGAMSAYAAIGISMDQKDTSKNVFHVYLGSLGLRSKAYYAANATPEKVKYQNAYKKLMRAVFTELGADSTAAQTAASDIYELERQLAVVRPSLSQLRNPQAVYNKWTLAKLDREITGITWSTVLKAVLSPADRSRIDDSTEVIIEWPAYLYNLSTILQNYNAKQEILANYLMWLAVQPTLNHIGAPLLPHLETFQRETSGLEPKARSTFCVGSVDKELGYAVSRLFVDRYFSPATRKASASMVEDIRQSFIDLLPTVPWMDHNTRTAAKAKAKAVTKHIGYPDFIKNDTALNAKFADMTINTTCHYCNRLESIRHGNQNNFAKLFKKPEFKFSMTAPTVNAYYSGTENVIVFPAGIFQPSFYYPDGPAAMNYGGIGTVVGHELTHGFDDKGRQYDKDGNLEPWWTQAAIDNFAQRASCIANQYDKYPVYNEHVIGNQSLGENIADHGGLKYAYWAYKNHVRLSGDLTLPGVNLTSDQLFYVSFARIWCAVQSRADALHRVHTDVHAPTNWRVIGTVSQDENFAKAFNCPVNSTMNPAKKCLLW